MQDPKFSETVAALRQALNTLIRAADKAPLPGSKRRRWEAAARLLGEHLTKLLPAKPDTPDGK